MLDFFKTILFIDLDRNPFYSIKDQIIDIIFIWIFTIIGIISIILILSYLIFC
jgi:hypothetical protein